MTRSGAPRPVAVAGVWAGVAAVMALLAGDYRLSVAVGAAVLAVAAVGVDLGVGYAGMLVFSAPAFMQVGALASALVGLRSGLPPTAASIVGVTAGLVAGLLLAVAAGLALRRVGGVGVALLTLFVFQLVRGVVRQQDAFGGTLGLSGVPPFEVGPFRAATPASQAVLVMLVLALVLGAATRFVRSGPGRELRAVNGDARAAASSGVDVRRRRFEVFVAGSLCATLAGSLYAHTLGYVSGDSLGLGVLMDLLLMVFLGGAGSVWGAAVGALLVRVVPELWVGPERLEVLARGAVFLLVLTVAPAGLAGAVRATAARWAPGGAGGTARSTAAGLTIGGAGRPPPYGHVSDVAATVRGRGGAERPVLRVTGLTRSFGGVRALDGVGLEVFAGEVCAVVGANGAGKTTLFNVITGAVGAERGTVYLDGVDITDLPPHRRARLGVARTFQEVRVFPGLTVLDHVLVGTRGANELGVGAALAGRARRTRTPGEAAALLAARQALATTGLGGMAAVPADQLPFGWQRRVELARALAGRPSLLLLDEPASGLSGPERRELLGVLRRVAGEAAVLVVEHDVDFVVDLAPRVVVLDGGRVIFDGATAAAVDDPAVIGAYLLRRHVTGS